MATVQTPIRGTQSFVGTLSSCWSRSSLTGLEVLWRWAYGVPALWLVLTRMQTVLLRATGGTLDLARLGLDKALLADPIGALTADPLGAVGKVTGAIGLVLPSVERQVVWLLPIMIAVWVVVSSLGRTLVLRQADTRLISRPVTLMALQAVRMLALATVFVVWFRCLDLAAVVAVKAPIAVGGEPNLVLFCAIVIVATLGLFVLWGTVSWFFSVAPLLAMLGNLGPLASFRAALRLGPLKGKLVEINLVMGIVKIALLVLAMVFSATPLPFQTVTTPEFVFWWNAGVAVCYLVASDFFHVARLMAYHELWRSYEGLAI